MGTNQEMSAQDRKRFGELILLAGSKNLTTAQIDSALQELHEMKARVFTKQTN